ncbi:MAG: hypothetical protein M3Z26_05030, partial [Bacteroidota bacterium]|nr:hypothetical protein [Bacteroidota bacterium]
NFIEICLDVVHVELVSFVTHLDNCTASFVPTFKKITPPTGLINFLKGISFKTSTKPFIADNIKIGEMLYAYSSQKSYENSDAYVIVATRHSTIPNDIINPPPGEYYELTFSYYNSHLY